MSIDRPRRLRCAVYTRKSSEEGLEQAFNSLDAQREACEAYIKSQAGEGWHLTRARYDDGGVSGGTLDRPALQQLLTDIKARKIDTVVVYKVDRLTRSLAGFAKIVEVFDAQGVSFVSVTQQFNTTTSMGRLTLNMLLSFAQFEREVTGERIRDKIAASKQKGMWMGGFVPLGYEAKDHTLVINEAEAEAVRTVFRLYLDLGNVRRVKQEADRLGLTTKVRQTQDGRMRGGRPFSRGYIYKLLGNQLYAGRIAHKSEVYKGQHAAIIDTKIWDAIQAKLASNACERRSGTRAAEPSLLAGLLYDEHGNRFSPSHAVKNGVRYRYYVSQVGLRHREGDAGSIIRVPAQEIEELVAAQIGSFLKDSGRLIDELGDSLAPRDQKHLIVATTKQAEQWPHIDSSERRALLLRIVAGITISEKDIRIILRRNGLKHAVLGDETSIDNAADRGFRAGAPDNGDELTLRVLARLKLCSGAMRLVIPPGQGQELRSWPNPRLIKALNKAHRWKAKLFSGDAPSISAIADSEGVTDRYVSRIMRLAFLAPDIVEAILGGYQPADLELERLMKGVPISWKDQRRVLGFSRD